MPPGQHPKLNPTECQVLRSWIAAGAPSFLVTDEYIHQSLLDDVRSLAPKERATARYFTFNHLLTDLRPLEEVSQQRRLLAALLRHLAGKKGLLLHPVDDQATLFRVDLRKLGWDRQPFQELRVNDDGLPVAGNKSRLNLFDLVLLEYPFGILPPESALWDELAKELLMHAAQVRPLASVRGDWFMNLATKRPLYQELLGTPADDTPLPTDTNAYASQPVGLARAAAELGLPRPSASLQKAFQKRGFADTVSRGAWEKAFPGIVRELKLGTPVPPYDALPRLDQEFPETLAVRVQTNKPKNIFAPGDKLEVKITNHTQDIIHVEMVYTSAKGEVFLVTPITQVAPGKSITLPANFDMTIQDDLGTDFVTVFASETKFPPGEWLRGPKVADRVVHPFYRLNRAGTGFDSLLDSSGLFRKTVPILIQKK
jgi:hypothetical protein